MVTQLTLVSANMNPNFIFQFVLTGSLRDFGYYNTVKIYFHIYCLIFCQRIFFISGSAGKLKQISSTKLKQLKIITLLCIMKYQCQTSLSSA